jgi:hypothetical protein
MSGFDPQWNATWGDVLIHYVRDDATLQKILQEGVIKDPPIFATPFRDFPPGGRVVIEIIGHEVVAGLEIYEATGWLHTTPPTMSAHVREVTIAPHPTLQPYQDKYERTIVPVVQA